MAMRKHTFGEKLYFHMKNIHYNLAKLYKIEASYPDMNTFMLKAEDDDGIHDCIEVKIADNYNALVIFGAIDKELEEYVSSGRTRSLLNERLVRLKLTVELVSNEAEDMHVNLFKYLNLPKMIDMETVFEGLVFDINDDMLGGDTIGINDIRMGKNRTYEADLIVDIYKLN